MRILPLSADAVLLHRFQEKLTRRAVRQVGTHITRVCIITVVDAGQEKFHREHIENVRIREGFLNGGVHACVQRINDR